MKIREITNEIEYKEKSYIYGFCKERDYPTRGKTSNIFFIKVKIGPKYLAKFSLIYRTTNIEDWIYLSEAKKKERVFEEIENYRLKSRKLKLKKLNLNN